VFTGLIREVGCVAAVDGGADGVRLTIDAPATARDAKLGDSIALSGVCLTVVERSGDRLAFDAVPETLARSSLQTLEPGSRVNVEPALRAGEPLGGHYVQGHVDGVGEIRSVEPEGDGRRIWVDALPELMRYVVEKGSVAVEGTSLTASGLPVAIAVALIPHTLEETRSATWSPATRSTSRPTCSRSTSRSCSHASRLASLRPWP
jgi:riboflavin synthase